MHQRDAGEEEDQADQPHVGAGDEDAGVGADDGEIRATLANSMTYQRIQRDADPDGGHKRKVHVLQHDIRCRHGLGAESLHQQRQKHEPRADVEHPLHGGWSAHMDDPLELLETEPPGLQGCERVPKLAGQEDHDQDERADTPSDHRRVGSTLDAQFGEAEVPKDEAIVGRGIESQRHKRRDQGDRWLLDAVEKAFETEGDDGEPHAPEGDLAIGDLKRLDMGRRTDQRPEGFGESDQGIAEERKDNRHVERLPGIGGSLAGAPAAEGLGGECLNTRGPAHPQAHHGENEDRRRADGRGRLGTEARDHDEIDESHRHAGDHGGDDRRGEEEESTDFTPYARRGGLVRRGLGPGFGWVGCEYL